MVAAANDDKTIYPQVLYDIYKKTKNFNKKGKGRGRFGRGNKYLGKFKTDGLDTSKQLNDYSNDLLKDTKNLIELNSGAYFKNDEGKPENLETSQSGKYYSNTTGEDADEEIHKQMERLDEIRKVMGDENGQRDVTELKMKSNRFHYFTFFFTFIIIIIYTVKVFTNSKNNTVETLILIVASLIVLYYLVNFIMEYLRKRH